MKKIILSFAVLLTFFASYSQQPAAVCPQVYVSCGSVVTQGDKASFTVNVSGGDANVSPTYNWVISNGTIESGQGTSAISVGTQGLTGTITATVDVGGYARECATSNSCTIEIRPAAKKQVGSGTFTNAAINLMVKEFIAFSRVDYDNSVPMAFVYLYPAKSWKPAQIAKMNQAIAKAFENNKIDKLNYKIVIAHARQKASYDIYSVPPGAEEPAEEK